MDAKRLSRTHARQRAKRVILLVEGDGPFRDQLEQRLRKRSFAVEVARTCEAALDMARTRHCDVAVVELPGLDRPSFALLQTLRWITPELQIVTLAGSTSVASIVEALRIYADDCALRPIDVEDFADRIAARPGLS